MKVGGEVRVLFERQVFPATLTAINGDGTYSVNVRIGAGRGVEGHTVTLADILI